MSFSESEIFRILENANAQDFPPDELRHILHAEEVRQKLVRVSTYYDRRPSSASLADLKKSIPKDKQEKDVQLIEAIACTLNLEHNLASTVHKEALLNDEQNEQHLNLSDDYYVSLDPVICVRDFYLEQRQYLWKIVQEIIRISLDSGHPYHLIAVEYVNMLCEKGFIESLIKSLKSLYSWQPFSIDEKYFPEVDRKGLRDFGLRNDDKWSEAILAESELAIDTLILVLYESASLNIENFSAVVTIAVQCEFNVPIAPFKHLELRSGDSSATQLASQNNSKRFHLKWLAFAISVFQYHRLGDGEDTEHPFFNNPVDDSHLNSVASISKILVSVKGPIAETMKLLWFLFLDIFDPNDMDLNFRSRSIEKAISRGAIETLTILCNDVLPTPLHIRHAGSESSSGSVLTEMDEVAMVLERDTEFQSYYLILQDCVNALISKLCTISSSFSHIDLLSQLIDISYRGDSLLCRRFWDSWAMSSASRQVAEYPLCRLIHELSNETWLEPLYMIRIVTAVSCFTDNSLEEIILLLMKPVLMTTSIKAGQVNIFNKEYNEFQEWDGWYQGLESHTSKYHSKQSRRVEWNSLRVALRELPSSQQLDDDLAALASPHCGTRGIVRIISPFPEDISSENYRDVLLTVQWDSKIEWFSTLIAILYSASTNEGFNKYDKDALYRVISSLTLFANILSQIPIQKISEIWEEVCVKMFFRKHMTADADTCYTLFRNKILQDYEVFASNNNASVVDYIKSHQQEFYEYFTHHGMNEQAAYDIASQFTAIYCPNFVDVITNISVSLMTSLMRCKIESPALSSGFNNSTVALDYTIWQLLLQKTLYLVQCVSQTSVTPSVALHILSKVSRQYALSGTNSWASTLFRISSALEGVTGRYTVMNQTCKLLQSLIQKLQSPMPPDSRDLYKLFCKFDHDGNGGIDREELRQGLNNFGYTITASAVNIVFQKIDEDNSGTVDFSELLHYANRTTLADVEDSYEDSNSDMFKAEMMLVGLLRDLTCPGGGVGLEMTEAVACSTVEYCINCLSQLDKWKHSTNIASRWNLTLSCLTVLHEILSRSSPSQCEPLKTNVSSVAWNFFLKKFVTEKPLQTSLMQLCLLQGLTALQASYTSAFRDVPRSFKAILTSTSQAARDLTAHDVLPINFSRGYYEVADSFEKQLVEKISLKALGVYSLIVDNYVSCTNTLPVPKQGPELNHSSLVIMDCFEQFIAHLFSNASSLTTLPVSCPRERSFPGTDAQLDEFPCSYFAVLFSFVDFPKRASKVYRARSELPREVMVFVVKLLSAMKIHNARRLDLPSLDSVVRSDPYSFLTGVGISNMTSLCVSLCASLKLETHLDSDILNFFMHLCAYEPLSLVQLFNVPNPAELQTATAKGNNSGGLIHPKESYLVQTIEELLKQYAEVCRADGVDTNIKYPEQYFKLLQLILMLMDQTEHKSVGRVMLYLCKKKSFWDHVTLPLMINVPEIEPNSSNEIVGSGANWDISEKDTTVHAIRLMCHSTSLRILARARFGLLFFVDERDQNSNKRVYESAEAAEDILDKFFDDKSRQNRFLSWVEFYTRVDVDSQMHNYATKTASKLGVHLETFISSPIVCQYQPYYARIQVSKFGEKYLYDTNVIDCMMTFAKGLCDNDLEYKNRFDKKESGKTWEKLVDAAKKLNLMWTIADAQTDLLKSWKEFIETFIKIPPNRPSNYERSPAKKQRDSVMERSESIGTPRGDASPSSKKQSSFKFDRRSYELASEIIRQVAGVKRDKDKEKGGKSHGGRTSDGEISHHFGADVAVEKCDLIVSMLHYQLRDVTHRDADPSSSRIAPRENIRFDKKKMEGLLQSLEVSFQRLTEGLYIRPPSYTQVRDYALSTAYWKQYKDKIMLRLLSAKLMLLQALCHCQQDQLQCDFTTKGQSAWCIDNLVCRQTFGNIQTALNATLQDSTSFSTECRSDENLGIPLPEKIILISLRLFNYIAPKSSDVSVESMIGWRDTIKSSDIGPMLVSIFRNVCTKNISHVNKQHEYSKWTERWNGRLAGGAFEVDIKGVSDSVRYKRAKTDLLVEGSTLSSDTVWATLNSVLDTFLAEGLCEGSLLFSALLESDLLVEFCQAPVLLALQQTLCRQNSALSSGRKAAYMAYNSATGEPSALMRAWCKVVQIAQCSLRVQSEAGDTYRSQIQAFISTFHPLLFLPLPARIVVHSQNHQEQSHYYSIQQLRLTNTVMLFFKDCINLFPTWKLLQADVYQNMIEKCLGVVSSISLAVGDNDKSECSQKAMSQTVVVISHIEREEACEKQPELSKGRERGATFDSPPSKDGDSWTTPPRGGCPGTPGTGSSFGGSFFGGKSATGKSNRNRDKQHNMSNFFIDSAWAMFAVMQPCLALIRCSINFSDICGEEYEMDYGYGGLRLRKDYCELPVGSQTYYMPHYARPNQPFTQGIIIKVNHDRKSYDIQATSGLVDSDISCNAVAFFVPPIIPYGQSTSSTSSVESRLVASSHVGSISSGFDHTGVVKPIESSICTTAHLLRLLICIRKWCAKWSDMEVFEHEKSLSMNMYVDLSVLCGQLVWVLVVNIAHHSCCASDDVYQGLEDQLDEIKELIKCDVELDERADAFFANPNDNWDAIRWWFERMCQRIMYRSGENKWADVVENVDTVRVETRPSLQLSHTVSVAEPKTGGTGSLRTGAAFV